MNFIVFRLIGGICILAMYSADSKLMLGATLTFERAKECATVFVSRRRMFWRGNTEL